jgi:PKD domain
MRRVSLAITLSVAVSLAATTGAKAVVVNDQGTTAGVALVPGTTPAPRTKLSDAGIPAATSNGPCLGICSHGGPVIHKNETFALVWDPNPHHHYAAPYVEQFLRDVADGSGTLTSPFAETSQYTDAGGRAANSSLYGGGSDDPTGYPANGCSVPPQSVCLTDAQLRSELQQMVVQNGLEGRVQPGFTPLLVLLTPPGVETCLDATGQLCSANSDATVVPAQFCSYHSQVNVGGQLLTYVVQPWTALTGCDEPDAPALTNPIDAHTLATDMGIRLVSPLSQAQIAAIVNPALNGWFADDGSEINDYDGCAPIGQHLDNAIVGSSGQNPYLLQREFNNAGVIVADPFATPCLGGVVLEPNFVVPSAIDHGDALQLDGSKTRSSLLVASYAWNFGDGTTSADSSPVHSYPKGGTYVVTLTVTDRGGNVRSLAQSIQVLGPNGQTTPSPANHPISKAALRVHLQLMPQGLLAMLRSGIVVRVSSNASADGIVTLSISRGDAKRARIRYGRAPTVVIGRGTVSRVRHGTISLHLRLSKSTATKLRHLRHVTVTVRLALVGAGGVHLAVDAAGRY